MKNLFFIFLEDNRIIGFWKSIDFINNKSAINPKIEKENLYLNKIIVSPDHTCVAIFKENRSRIISYSKGFIANLCIEDTLCAYELKSINGEEFMIVEWKSGDYVYGKMINGYYVLKKMK